MVEVQNFYLVWLYEGLSQTKLDILHALCKDLNKINSDSGVYVTYTRKYHDKVYYFDNGTQDNIFVGSSNFSTSGTSGNIECTNFSKRLNYKN